MTRDTDTSLWPMPSFSFSVEIPDVGKIPFAEVSGLDNTAPAIEYRSGDSKHFSTIKRPGLDMPRSITLKQGVLVNDTRFRNWSSQMSMNTIKPQTVTISLLDRAGDPTMVWQLANAWPTRITGSDLKSTGTEIAIESVELCYETLTVRNGG